jgi:hypothetical protein
MWGYVHREAKLNLSHSAFSILHTGSYTLTVARAESEADTVRRHLFFLPLSMV